VAVVLETSNNGEYLKKVQKWSPISHNGQQFGQHFPTKVLEYFAAWF